MTDTPLYAVREPHLRMVAIYANNRLLTTVAVSWRGVHDPTPFGVAAEEAMAAHGWIEYGPTEVLANTNHHFLHVTRRAVREAGARAGQIGTCTSLVRQRRPA